MPFTPDGRRLTYSENVAQLSILPLELQGGQWKPGTPERMSASGFTETWPSFSPDGRWLAYESNESGQEEVYVRAFPPSSGQGGKWLVSNSGGSEPAWSRNGRELVYRSGDQIMTSRYTVNGDTFVAEKPRVWIDRIGGVDVGSGAGRWDPAPDGKGVVVAVAAESASAASEHQVVLLFNFFDELRRRVPLGK